ncbi:unnamed protein product [Leptosia nina]|uniref:Poly [ADP-ribose] polymerase n=1 Tax=Leptosia nina TaxID=320188 RepID=A0AAV1JVB3_9NEOP
MLPYIIEYAKSDKTKCNCCNNNISKKELRIGIRFKPVDYYIQKWYHETCFFKKGKRLGSANQFDKFNTIRYDDQQRIKAQLVNTSENTYDRELAGQNQFFVETSPNSKAVCRSCFIKIVKDDIRISKTVYEEKYGEIQHCYHVRCFSNVKEDLCFYAEGDCLPGFDTLSSNDKVIIQSSILRSSNFEILKTKTEEGGGSSESQFGIKKYLVKVGSKGVECNVKGEVNKEYMESSVDETDNVLEEKIQNDLFHGYKENLQTVSTKDLAILCKRNNLKMFKGTEEPLDLLADCMAFGALERCPQCRGQLQLKTFYYKCTGFLNPWTTCDYQTRSPRRFVMTIPAELQHYAVFKNFRPTLKKRIFTEEPPLELKPSPKRIKTEYAKPPLKNVQFCIYGFKADKKEMIKRRILRLGGCVAVKLLDTVAAVISTKEAIQKNNSFVKKIHMAGYHVVEESFLEYLETYVEGSISVNDSIKLIEEQNISEHSFDIYSRVPRQVLDGEPLRVSSGMYIPLNQSEVSSLKVKDGVPLVMGTGLENRTHVYREFGNPYSATLNRVDVNATQGGNRSYVLQLLEADRSKRYFVISSWGETGSKQKIDIKEFEEYLGEAKAFFKDVFFKKTGNTWAERFHFDKKYGKFDLIQMADLNQPTVRDLSLDTQSELPVSVQQLLKLLFDINIIHKTIADIEIDTNKMPLGVPCDEQLLMGFNILWKLLEILDQKTVHTSAIKELSNKFYTKIPHKGGIEKLKLLDNRYIILTKIQMLCDLKNTHISYKLLEDEMDSSISLIEQYYMKLKTEILPLDEESMEYSMIMKYFINTQSSEHLCRMQIEKIFKVEREGEAEMFEPYKSLERKLLWHGSRLSNIKAILLQGLRIAPSGVHITGAMFGQGIYFADVVSKSSQYIRHTPDHPQGVLLLCEVALGNMKKCVTQEYITSLPEGVHSVWGVGRNHPDPSVIEVLFFPTLEL